MGKFYGQKVSREFLNIEKKIQIVDSRKENYEIKKSNPFLRLSFADVKKLLNRQHFGTFKEFSFLGKNIHSIGFTRHNYKFNRDEILSPYGKSIKKWNCKDCKVYMYRKCDLKIFVVTALSGKIIFELFELSPRINKKVKHNHASDIHVLPGLY